MHNLKLKQSMHPGVKDSFVYLPAKEGAMVKVTLRYSDSRNKGAGLSVTHIKREIQGNMISEQSMPMDDCNFNYHLVDFPRYNRKKMEKIASAIDTLVADLSVTAWAHGKSDKLFDVLAKIELKARAAVA